MKNGRENSCSAEQGQEINLLKLLRTVVSNLSLIMRLTMAGTVAALLVSLAVKNIYTARGTILPPQKDTGGASAILAQMGGVAALSGLAAGGSSSDLYVGILKSRSVADAVIERLGLHKELKGKNADDTRKRLQKMVNFQAAKDGIITITAEYDDPAKAALMVNTFVSELGKKSLQLNLTKAGTERSFLEKRLVVVNKELKAAEDEMKSFQEKYKTLKADTQAAAAIEGIARVKAEIVTKEVQLAALRNSMTDESPDVRALLAAISRLRGQLATMSGGGEAGGVIPSVGNAPAIGLEYVRRLRELKTQEALYEQLTKQFELARINEARDSSSIQVLDEAVPPIRKSKPVRSLIVLLAAVLSCFGAIMFVLVREYLSHLSPEDSAMLVDIKEKLRVTFRLRGTSRPGSRG